MADTLLKRQLAIRDSLGSGLGRHLIGPVTVDEVLEEAPLDRYVSGILFPRVKGGATVDADPVADPEVPDEDGDSAPDPAVALSNVQYPSSAGVTFAVEPSAEEVVVTSEAALYDPLDGGQWRRRALGPFETPIPVGTADFGTRPLAGGFELYFRVRDEISGARSVTVVLMNTNEAEPGQKDAACLFQVGLKVTSSSDGPSPLIARPDRIDVQDEDMKTNALLYRERPEFAIGHGCAATWQDAEEVGRAASVGATFFPEFDVRIMESNPDIPVDRMGFDGLAAAERHDLVADLETFLAGYSRWIEDRRRSVSALTEALAPIAERHLDECERVRSRIQGGIELLRGDDRALRAFQLANRAMADQMERARPDEDRARHGWRPFQLAFLLLTIPSIVDPESEDRGIADLLWFPTGGGKTEAYLGLFAFTVFHRRMLSSDASGVTAIMRYTLRLLTAQQFERAARVVCACDVIREEESLGSEPISLGLYVGTSATPNKLERARAALTKLLAGNDVPTENPVQLRSCPWCQAPLDASHYSVRETPRRLHIECRNAGCKFKAGLPVWVVDEDLYRVRPTLVIGTVDKFASLPWRPETRNLFNLGSPAEPPPDLVIQDELHLISGPLGTMTGLYETAVDILCSQSGRRPKLIASTATIRRAAAQAEGLFAREMRQFPPPGIDPTDSWFATEAPPDRQGTRRYVGLMAPGVSHASLMIRTYAALLHETNQYPKGPELDPYWSLVGYFNSLRVLGAARMQVQDDVHDWLELAADGAEPRRLREPIELTSRADSTDIPEYLERMAIELPDPEVLDVILATNMISVGVDVDRLGLMVVMGQPQAAAEYIQATSRVGRKYPGLVVTLLNAARSRDRSHFEAFRGFHSALYRSVEASSVTPFSPRARDRGLHAVLVAISRLTIEPLRENAGAVRAPDHLEDLRRVRDAITERAHRVDPDQAEATKADLDKIIAEWVTLARQNPELVYESWDGTATALLSAAGPENEQSSSFSTMWSLRDVDVQSNLYFAGL